MPSTHPAPWAPGLLTVLSALRLGFGASCMLFPHGTGTFFGLPLADSTAVTLLRGAGARDLVLGALLLAAWSSWRTIQASASGGAARGAEAPATEKAPADGGGGPSDGLWHEPLTSESTLAEARAAAAAEVTRRDTRLLLLGNAAADALDVISRALELWGGHVTWAEFSMSAPGALLVSSVGLLAWWVF